MKVLKILNCTNFLANPKGILICWNADYHAMGQANRSHVILKPGLEVKFNIPRRQEYCAKHGLNFDLGAGAAVPHMIQPGIDHQPLPPGYGIPATAPPYYIEENKYYSNSSSLSSSSSISHRSHDANGVNQID